MAGLRGTLVLPDREVEGGLRYEGGVITEVGPEVAGSDLEDLRGCLIFPGFYDLHVHGGSGADFMDGTPEAAEQVLATCARGGAAGVLATTLTAPQEEIVRAVRAVAQVRERGGELAPMVLGVHLEGPYINRLRRGAQDEAYVRAPDLGELESLLRVAPGLVRLVTLAPELPGAREAVAYLRSRGVLVAMGHTDATFAQAEEAVNWGVSRATHCFNGMRPLHHREPGVLGAALVTAVTCELIADGVHVHPGAMRLLWAAKGPAGMHLVTDAMRAAGQGDGEYTLGRLKVRVEGGAARLEDGTLAGSTLTMAAAVRNVIVLLGLSPREAAQLASTTPARELGLSSRKGRLAPGYDADLTVLRPDLLLERTVVAGRVVYRA